MVRTKKHFRPPSPSSGSSSSEEEDDDNLPTQPQTASRGMGKQLHFSGGKQLSVVGGGFRGGKQLNLGPQQESEEESSSSSSSSEDEEAPSQTITYNRSTGGGKQLRVPGGKQFPPAPANEESSDDDEDEEEEAYRPPSGSGGKQFGGKAFRGGKQLVRPPTPDMDDDSDSSSDEEEEVPPPTTTVVQRGQGGGKQLRMPATAEETKKEESADDMEESEEEDEEEEPIPTKAPEPPPPKKAPVPPPEPEESSSEEEIITQPKRRGRPPAAASTRPQRSTRSTKKVVDESSSDESSEEEFELDMETFDNNKLIEDEADRKYLEGLTELEREAVLAERFEKLKSEADVKKAMREVKRREKEQKKQTKPKTKAPKKRPPPKKEPPKKRGRKAKKEESESSDDDQDEDYDEGVPDTSGDAALAASMSGKRVSTRNLDAKGNKFKRAAALAKIRENRASKAPTKDESDSDLDYGKDSDDSDDDYEDSTMIKPWQQTARKTTQLERESSEDESVDERRGKEPGRKRAEDIPADLQDFALVTIPRRRLIRWCNEPFFEDAIKQCYVRLGIGRDSKTQKACYRLCKVIGVESKKEYSFPPELNQMPVTTNKWLKLSFGKNENVFKMITVSDHRPTDEDMKQLIGQMKTDRLSDNILSKKKAIKLRKKQDNLVNNYTYTKEDVEKLVTEKKKRNKKASNIGLEKTHIAIAVQAAKDAVKAAEERLEEARVAQMEADDAVASTTESNVTKAREELEDAKALLEERIHEQKRILKDEEDRINRLKGSSKVQNWVKVNQRARLANQNADFLSYKQQLAKEKAEASAEPKFDPFARRKVKPKNLWEVGGKQSNDKGSDDANGLEEEKKDSHPSEDAATSKDTDKDSKQVENGEAQKLETTGQSAPFVFDDDINIGDIANLGLGLKKATNRTRKGISLDDYQSRKAAGTL